MILTLCPRSDRLALAEMKLIIARIVWNFDLELTADSKTWGEDLKIFHLWDITPLYLRFTHVERA
jgi:cytochrome P450